MECNDETISINRNQKQRGHSPPYGKILDISETERLVTNCDRFRSLKHASTTPYAFTEQGIAMLSSVLRSDQAVEVNIAIMRTFVHLRRIMADNSLLRARIESLEKKYDRHEEQIQQVFDVLKAMLTEDIKPQKQIGYHTEAGGISKKAKVTQKKSNAKDNPAGQVK